MTREEAIEVLNKMKYPQKVNKNGFIISNVNIENEALEMAIKALEQEPCKVSEYDKDHIWYKGHQYISLRRFLEVKAEAEQEPCDKCKYFDGNSCEHYDYKVGYTQGYEDGFGKSQADAYRKGYEDGYAKACVEELNDDAVYQRGYEDASKRFRQEPCDDAISRQAVCEIISDIRDCISVEGYWAILERLKKLPSVRPQEQTGMSDAVLEHYKKLAEHYNGGTHESIQDTNDGK